MPSDDDDDDAGYYAALGVASSASDKELRRAYFALAKKLHPDRASAAEAEAAAARLRDIGEAWSVLKNKKLKRIYDESGKAGLEDHENGSSSDDDDDGERRSGSDGGGGSSDSDDVGVAAFFTANQTNRSGGPRATPFAAAAAAAAATAALATRTTAATLSEADVRIQVADAVAEAIKRTEARAAARYERALILLLMSLDEGLSEAQARSRVQQAWDEAEQHGTDDEGQQRSIEEQVSRMAMSEVPLPDQAAKTASSAPARPGPPVVPFALSMD